MTPSEPSYREIPLTQGYVALVSAEDYEDLFQFKWHVHFSRKNSGPYAARMCDPSHKPRVVKMHRQIMGLAYGQRLQVDHIDGNGLNNRRDNLRLATSTQNKFNTSSFKTNKSGFKGVHWNCEKKKWTAMISVENRTKYLGRFDTPQEAHAAYREAAMLLRGSFARFN